MQRYRISFKATRGRERKYFRYTIKAKAGKMVDAISEGRKRVERKLKPIIASRLDWTISLVSASPIVSPEDL